MGEPFAERLFESGRSLTDGSGYFPGTPDASSLVRTYARRSGKTRSRRRLVNVSIVVVRAYPVGEVTPGCLGDPGLLRGRAVLVHTGWARRWRTAGYREPGRPHLTAAAVDLLVGANVAIVGIDAGAVDDPARPGCPGPDALLGADIPILEHLTNLHLVPDIGARLTAMPPPMRDVAAAGVRAVAVLPR